MKIFRAIDEREKLALLKKNDILFPHNTCKRKEWILKPHPEDYETGKFFFFTMEDALLYAKEQYIAWHKKAAILEMNVDEKHVLPYLAYGIYTHPDYDKNGEWDNQCGHAVPELLLPYKTICKDLERKHFRILEFNDKEFYKLSKCDLHKFSMPYEKDRPISFVKMGKVLSGLKSSERSMVYYQRELQGHNCEYNEKWLKEAQEKHKKCKEIFPQTFEDFMKCMREYEWKDFRVDNSKDYIPSTNLIQTQKEI